MIVKRGLAFIVIFAFLFMIPFVFADCEINGVGGIMCGPVDPQNCIGPGSYPTINCVVQSDQNVDVKIPSDDYEPVYWEFAKFEVQAGKKVHFINSLAPVPATTYNGATGNNGKTTTNSVGGSNSAGVSGGFGHSGDEKGGAGGAGGAGGEVGYKGGLAGNGGWCYKDEFPCNGNIGISGSQNYAGAFISIQASNIIIDGELFVSGGIGSSGSDGSNCGPVVATINGIPICSRNRGNGGGGGAGGSGAGTITFTAANLSGSGSIYAQGGDGGRGGSGANEGNDDGGCGGSGGGGFGGEIRLLYSVSYSGNIHTNTSGGLGGTCCSSCASGKQGGPGTAGGDGINDTSFLKETDNGNSFCYNGKDDDIDGYMDWEDVDCYLESVASAEGFDIMGPLIPPLASPGEHSKPSPDDWWEPISDTARDGVCGDDAYGCNAIAPNCEFLPDDGGLFSPCSSAPGCTYNPGLCEGIVDCSTYEACTDIFVCPCSSSAPPQCHTSVGIIETSCMNECDQSFPGFVNLGPWTGLQCISLGCTWTEYTPHCTGTLVDNCPSYLDEASCTPSYCKWTDEGDAFFITVYKNFFCSKDWSGSGEGFEDIIDIGIGAWKWWDAKQHKFLIHALSASIP